MHWARRGCPLPKFRERESPTDVEAVKALLEDCVPPRNDIGKVNWASKGLDPLILSVLVEDARRVRDVQDPEEEIEEKETPENLNAEPSPEERRVHLYLWALGPTRASTVVRSLDSRSDLVSSTPEERTTWQPLLTRMD